MRLFAALAALLVSACATAPMPQSGDALQFPGARVGLVVTTLSGREIVAINADERFTPASNTKMFTVAAAFRYLPGLNKPDEAGGLSIWIEDHGDGSPPDLVLRGSGDATSGDGDACLSNCLIDLADAVIEYGFPAVGDIIADDSLFPDERWGAGWAWNNLETRSGTAISAITINDNELAIDVRPTASGQPPNLSWREGDDLYTLVNSATTIATGETDLWVEHRPNSNTARVYGSILASDPPQTLRIGVDDPALLAAKRLARLLDARGFETGKARTRHRSVTMLDDPTKRVADQPAPRQPEPVGTELARLTPLPLKGDLAYTLKASQNLHAELILRRLALVKAGGASGDGLALVTDMLTEAGIDRAAWDLYDGSGMSSYNRITPRMITRFLTWTQKQPWGEDFQQSLAVGGVDGTLIRRFKGTPLEGKVFAKTGSLQAVNALSGFLITATGNKLAFSAFITDAPSQATGANAAIDAALLKIAAEN